MTNYTNDPSFVRVDFFKPSGKWYTTEAVMFVTYDGCIHKAFSESLDRHLSGRLEGMIAVCITPHHKNGHPLMQMVGDNK